MQRDRVQVLGHSPAAPDAVWAVLRDFCGLWHPLITGIHPERDAQGGLIRAFTVQGEDTVYRERLTWYSDSDRSLGYTHLAGIAGVESYNARLTVTAAEDGGSAISWSAEVSAPSGRLVPICDGTRAVFEMGIAALTGAVLAEEQKKHAARKKLHPMQQFRMLPQPILEARVIDDLPWLALSVAGKGERLCLFLHGIGGNRTNWDAQVAQASSHGLSAALDLRGYGGSSLGPSQSKVDDYCDDILRVMQVLGAKRLVLVGLSYGSWIATSFAIRHPDLLDGLVLSGGCTGMSEAGPEEREAFRLSREVPLDAGQTPRDFAPAVVKVLAGPDASPEVRQQLFDSMAAIPTATYRDALICFTNPLERFDFSRLTMPVLLMTGAHDRLAPPNEIRSVAGRIWDLSSHPDVRFEEIAGAGHLCNLEQPQTYNRHLADFLRRLP